MPTAAATGAARSASMRLERGRQQRRRPSSRVSPAGASNPDAAGLRLDQPPRNRQPEPDAAAVRIVRLAAGHAEELLEHPLAQLRRDAGPFVDDRHPHLAVVVRAPPPIVIVVPAGAYLLALSSRM